MSSGLKLGTLVLNVCTLVILFAAMASLFVWEASATRADKDFAKKASQGHKSMY